MKFQAVSGWYPCNLIRSIRMRVCSVASVESDSDPMDCSLPGSSVHGILQPRILEGVAMPSPRGSSWPAAAAKSLQSCPTLCDPIDGSPPGSTVPGILQARTLEWVAISFSSAWKWKVKVKSLSRVRLFETPWTAAHQAPLSMGFSGKSTGVECHRLLWIFIRNCTKFLFYWNRVDLQHGVSFCCTVIQWYIYTFFHILLYYGLSQDVEYKSLCYTV